MNHSSNRPTSILTWLKKRSEQIILVYISLFLVTGLLTLPLYGLTWDEGLGNLFFGERYLLYLTSFNQKYLDFDMELDYHHERPLNLFQSPFHNNPTEFPALADTLSAATMYVFSYQLGWLNPIDGFHAFTVILAAVFLVVLYKFTAHRLGRFTAGMAVIYLSTFPRFWADMHFNVKDVPETIFFGMTILAYWQWYEKPRWTQALVTGLLFGSALAIKANAIAIPVILLASILPWNFQIQAWLAAVRQILQKIGHYFLMGAGALGFYFLSWPYLYADPINRAKSYWAYIFSQGGRVGSGFWHPEPLRQVLTTLPEVMLVFLIIGLLINLTRGWQNGSGLSRLLLVWLAAPILRISLPQAVNFDGIRHFMEYLPAAALLAGIGSSTVVDWLQRKINLPRLASYAIPIVLLGINLVQISVNFQPYLHLYYNSFTGGLSGARDRFLGSEASDYWASSYRQGMEWLNQNAPPNSQVQALVAGWLLDISGPVLLRPDITVIPSGQLRDFEILRQEAVPTYLMFILRDLSSDEVVYCMTREIPVYEIEVDGVVILQIYQFGGQSSSLLSYQP